MNTQAKVIKSDNLIRFILVALFFVFAASCIFYNISCIDIGFHIRTGELIFESGKIPTQNTFSFTMPDHPWILHQWLGAVLWYFAYFLGGANGIIILRVATFLLLISILLKSLNKINKDHLFFKLILLTVFVVLVRKGFFARPFIFSAIFLSLMQYLVLRMRTHDKAKFFIPVIFIIWAHVHAGFMYGVAFLLAHLVGEFISRYYRRSAGYNSPAQLYRILFFGLGGALLGFLLVNIINPNGIKGLLFPFQCFNNPLYQRIIVEYKFSSFMKYKLLYATLVALSILLLLNRKKISIGDFLVVLGYAILAVKTNRNILFFGIVAMPVLFKLGLGIGERIGSRFSSLWMDLAKTTVFILLWTTIIVSFILPDKMYQFGFGFFKPYYPQELLNFIKKEKPKGNIFNDMRFGGPVIWFLYPEYKVFIDGRFEAYQDSLWTEEYYPTLTSKRGWQRMFRKRNITMCLLSYASLEKPNFIGKILQNLYTWKIVAFNDSSILFMKDTEENKDIISKFTYHYLRPLDDSVDFITEKNAKHVAEEAKRAMKFSEYSSRPRLFLARALLKEGKYEESIEVYKTLMAVPGINSLAKRDIAYCQYMLGKDL